MRNDSSLLAPKSLDASIRLQSIFSTLEYTESIIKGSKKYTIPTSTAGYVYNSLSGVFVMPKNIKSLSSTPLLLNIIIHPFSLIRPLVQKGIIRSIIILLFHLSLSLPIKYPKGYPIRVTKTVDASASLTDSKNIFK